MKNELIILLYPKNKAVPPVIVVGTSDVAAAQLWAMAPDSSCYYIEAGGVAELKTKGVPPMDHEPPEWLSRLHPEQVVRCVREGSKYAFSASMLESELLIVLRHLAPLFPDIKVCATLEEALKAIGKRPRKHAAVNSLEQVLYDLHERRIETEPWQILAAALASIGVPGFEDSASGKLLGQILQPDPARKRGQDDA